MPGLAGGSQAYWMVFLSLENSSKACMDLMDREAPLRPLVEIQWLGRALVVGSRWENKTSKKYIFGGKNAWKK